MKHLLTILIITASFTCSAQLAHKQKLEIRQPIQIKSDQSAGVAMIGIGATGTALTTYLAYNAAENGTAFDPKPLYLACAVVSAVGIIIEITGE